MTIPLGKCPFAYVSSVAALMLCMATTAADVDVGDGANDNTYTDATAYAGATKIIKTGTGKTTLSFGNSIFDTGWIDAAVFHEALKCIAGDLTTTWVKAT